MSKGKIGAIAVAVIVVLILFSGYNSLVTANENINGKWSQVENQLQRRSDLIPEPCCHHQRHGTTGKGCFPGSQRRAYQARRGTNGKR